MRERNYKLDAEPKVFAGKRRRIVPPRPKPGERAPRPYSQDVLDALLATARAFPAQALASLKAPTSSRITDWPPFRKRFMRLKRKLANLRKRNGFPASLTVTEFDPVEVNGDSTSCADFHTVFAEPLSENQQAILQVWWLKETGLANNQSRAFHYGAAGGGRQLQDYIAKDMDKRRKPWHWVKFPAAWLPARLDVKLWFVIGARRHPSREGRAIRASEGLRRRSFECEHGRIRKRQVSASIGTSEREHAPPFITADESAGSAGRPRTVSTESAPTIQPNPQGRRVLCEICPARFARQRRSHSRVCTGDVRLALLTTVRERAETCLNDCSLCGLNATPL